MNIITSIFTIKKAFSILLHMKFSLNFSLATDQNIELGSICSQIWNTAHASSKAKTILPPRLASAMHLCVWLHFPLWKYLHCCPILLTSNTKEKLFQLDLKHCFVMGVSGIFYRSRVCQLGKYLPVSRDIPCHVCWSSHMANAHFVSWIFQVKSNWTVCSQCWYCSDCVWLRVPPTVQPVDTAC